MSLQRRPNLTFSHQCPHCGNTRVNSGQWFYAIAGYKCGGCGKNVRVTYDDKLKLLRDRGVAANPGGIEPRLSSTDGGSETPPAPADGALQGTLETSAVSASAEQVSLEAPTSTAPAAVAIGSDDPAQKVAPVQPRSWPGATVLQGPVWRRRMAQHSSPSWSFSPAKRGPLRMPLDLGSRARMERAASGAGGSSPFGRCCLRSGNRVCRVHRNNGGARQNGGGGGARARHAP